MQRVGLSTQLLRFGLVGRQHAHNCAGHGNHGGHRRVPVLQGLAAKLHAHGFDAGVLAACILRFRQKQTYANTSSGARTHRRRNTAYPGCGRRTSVANGKQSHALRGYRTSARHRLCGHRQQKPGGQRLRKAYCRLRHRRVSAQQQPQPYHFAGPRRRFPQGLCPSRCKCGRKTVFQQRLHG